NSADIEPTSFWKRLEEKGVYERIWERFRLYEDDSNPVIQALSVIGRYHGQYASVDADQGRADGWENRRTYVGAEALLYRHWTVELQMKSSEDLQPFYDGLYQAFVQWAPNDSLELTVGRLDCLFPGLERSTSSNRIVPVERGLVANQVTPAEAVGAFVEGRQRAWSYRGAVMSGTIDREFTDWSGGVGFSAGAGVDLPLLYAEGTLTLDYLY